jgi:large subunit ribosomal protein L23
MKTSADATKMNQNRLYKVILAPLISEKSTMIAEKARYFAFRVANDTTKPEIKRAVEFLFGVDVEAVKVSVVKGKKKRFKNILGVRNNWKKAYVKLKEGQSIDFAGNE